MSLSFCASEHPARAEEADTWQRALSLYRQKRFDEACRLFETVAKRFPQNGGAWADLGACELRRGRTKAAIHASLLAVKFGNEAIRRNAYFNLDRLKHHVRLPDPPADAPADAPADGAKCDVLKAASEFECSDTVSVCSFNWQQYGSGGGHAGSAAAFGSSRELLGTDEVERKLENWPNTMDTWPNTIDVLREGEELCGYCLQHAWQCGSSELVTTRADACFEAQTGSKPSNKLCLTKSAECDRYTKCFDDACQVATAAESAPKLWPEAAKEIDRKHAACDDCGIYESTTCRVVSVDPCNRRVGYVCSKWERGKLGQAIEIRELSLQE